jgi:aspartate/methionine/tyrosine aminotransferase
VLAGASEGILLALSATVAMAAEAMAAQGKENDGRPVVIAQAPGYQSLYAVARAAGAEVVLWTPEDELSEKIFF